MFKWFLAVSLLLIARGQDLDLEDSTSIETSFSEAEVASISQGADNFEFQAEVARLMEIIVNSLYKTRDIFLRELISNANDAIDKIRYQSLTDASKLAAKSELDIKIQANKEAGTLTILDSGIGMTKEELAKNLGTIAHSGTASFLDAFSAASESGDNPLQLIGQFGVGFYSAFLVADEVTVISKSPNSDKQYIWRSQAQGNFTVSEDPRGDTLGRGTAVILKIKEDAQNFLENEEIEQTVKRYSEFMQYPIYLYSSRTETIEEASDDTSDESDEKEEDDLAVEDEDAEDKPKTKSTEKTTYYWKRLNSQKPIWSRRPTEVSNEEYEEFYKIFAHDTESPLTHSHFRAEGEIEFDSILYVPPKAPPGFYDQYYQSKSTLKLYVRKVLVADEFEDIIPRYLNFIKGLVDSNDLPLNVNREDLQKSKIMTIISRKLTRKALDMLRNLARKEEEDAEEADDENEDGEDSSKAASESGENEVYAKFWEEFGKSIKLGILEDTRNRKRLLDLLRFPSAQSPTKPISLEKYIENMKEGQKFIYYIAAGSSDEAENSPFMERFRAKGFDVLYFTDNLDEYLNLQEYDDVPFQSITKEDVELDGKKMKEFLKEKEEEFSELRTWLKELYGNKVSKVQVSNTLAESPMAISTGKYGYSANMERIAKAQAFGGQYPMRATKILQINYRHPIIIELKKRVEDGDTDSESLEGQKMADYANILLDSALIKSGFEIETDDQTDYDDRVQRIIRNALEIPTDATLEPEPAFANELDSEDDENDDEDEDETDEMDEMDDEDKEEL